MPAMRTADYKPFAVIASVKKDWTKQKHKISEIKSIELYVKPEDYAVYYVINGEHTGKVWL